MEELRILVDQLFTTLINLGTGMILLGVGVAGFGMLWLAWRAWKIDH